MKVLLINPPDFHEVKTPGPVQVLFSQHRYAPPIGLMYLKSYLKRHHPCEVEIFNFQVPAPPSYQEFRRFLRDFKPRVAGITVTGVFWFDALQVARLIKAESPDTLVVAGGPNMWVFPAETLSHPEFDVVVQGEGEVTFSELVGRVEAGQSLEGLPGTWIKIDGRPAANPPRTPQPDPDVFPFPDRSDFFIPEHRVSADRFSPAAVILTSRGCPYQCAFCQNMDRIYRKRKPERVVEEMLLCKDMGYRAVDFYDDTFNLSRNQVVALCEEILEQKVNLPWICRARVDRFDRDLARLMAEAGCERIQFGVESASQEILDRIKKGITVEQCREAFAAAKSAGISTLGYFIIGFPGETMEQARKTLEFAFELDPDFAMCFPLLPIPGTPLYEEALNDPDFGGDYLREFVLNPRPDHKIKLWPTMLSEKQIMSLLRGFYLRFYFRPSYILKRMKTVSGAEDFRVKVRTAWQILKSLFA